MKIEKVRVFGFEPALRGMRNPMESWDRSDSTFYADALFVPDPSEAPLIVPEQPRIGPADMERACKLIKGGTEHRKFIRQIMIWVDLTLPRYCWQELDTYKVSTVRMSCSTMHRLGFRLLTQEDFELEISETALKDLNTLVAFFQKAKDDNSKEVRFIRRRMKNDLPEGYLQKATFSLSYETALSIIRQRHKHRLDEWHWESPNSICSWLLSLPYMMEFATASMEGVLIAPSKPASTVVGEPDSGSTA